MIGQFSCKTSCDTCDWEMIENSMWQREKEGIIILLSGNKLNAIKGDILIGKRFQNFINFYFSGSLWLRIYLFSCYNILYTI